MSETEAAPQPTTKPFESLKSVKTDNVDRAVDHIPDAEWYIVEGVPGVGDRPEWLPPKFKTVKDMANSYTNLEKSFSNTGAPEEYDFGDNREIIDTESPHIKELVAFAKDKRMSQEAFGTFINKFVDYSKSKQPNMDEEIAKIGPDANQKITTIETWAQNTLSQKSCDAISKIAKIAPAEMVTFLDEVRQYQRHQATNIPPDNGPSVPFKKVTKEELVVEMGQNQKRWDTDPFYREDWRARMAQAIGEG